MILTIPIAFLSVLFVALFVGLVLKVSAQGTSDWRGPFLDLQVLTGSRWKPMSSDAFCVTNQRYGLGDSYEFERQLEACRYA